VANQLINAQREKAALRFILTTPPRLLIFFETLPLVVASNARCLIHSQLERRAFIKAQIIARERKRLWRRYV
jgi:hypothetical protein